KLTSLPNLPGVYLFRDKTGKVIYIGKARVLRQRVRQYFQKSHDGRDQFDALVSRIADVEVIPTDNELEALILENNLVRDRKPRYNIELRDDKSFPFLRITKECFPRIFLTRHPEKDGSRYFGPFSNLVHLKPLIHVLRGLLRIRTCNLPLTVESVQAGKFKKCIEYDIGRCNAPCIALETESIYNAHVRDYVDVLQGHGEKIVAALQEHMETLAEEMRFEEAARLRDQLRSLNKLSQRQKVISPHPVDYDAVAIAIEDNEGCAVVFQVRSGRMMGRLHYILRHLKDAEESAVMAQFLQQYYAVSTLIPPELYLQVEPVDSSLLRDWLSERSGCSVKIFAPKMGDKARFLRLAYRNAELLLGEYRRAQARRERIPKALSELQKILRLPTLPRHIEAFDISTLQGREKVGSLVVFHDGRPTKSQYRRFAIRHVAEQDDYACMKEVIRRRFSRLLREKGKKPDLVLVDGGKGQLSAAGEALQSLDVTNQPIIGLAKRLEEVFLPDDSMPQNIPRTSSALKLLQSIRDEAHRFAITYHRLLRKRKTLESVLDEIPGIGPARRRNLLNHFGTMSRLRNAEVHDLESVPGISPKLARAVYEFFRAASREESAKEHA
ncbi:MAG: excinuclease ABC subunit C, partial [Calditrichaeota bacterium]|nr:excinuclease ABC subunit C [Calditrichota bacterium]